MYILTFQIFEISIGSNPVVFSLVYQCSMLALVRYLEIFPKCWLWFDKYNMGVGSRTDPPLFIIIIKWLETLKLV